MKLFEILVTTLGYITLVLLAVIGLVGGEISIKINNIFEYRKSKFD